MKQGLLLFLTFSILNLSKSDQNLCSKPIVDRPLNETEKKNVERLKFSQEEENIINQPTFTDQWGFVNNWIDLDDGWYTYRRYLFYDSSRSLQKQINMVKKYTKNGYKVMDIPKFLYKTLLEERNLNSLRVEKCQYGINCYKSNEKGELINRNLSWMYSFNEDQYQMVLNTVNAHLKKVLEKWAKVHLSPNGLIYGVRRYTRGASLLLHVDQLPTHIISAILQVSLKYYSNISNLSHSLVEA